MASVPYSNDQFAEEAAAFAEKITPARARWEYCFKASSFVYDSPRFGRSICLNERTFPVCDRLVGVYPGGAKVRLGKIKRLGLDGALEWDARQPRTIIRPWFSVGPMQAWHFGHLYFARVKSHPHVVKIGFSRRVRDRVDDIESKVKTALFVEKGQMRVGTLADEHWWHKNWDDHRISGEWFFDPFTTERTLPAFLAEPAKQEVA